MLRPFIFLFIVTPIIANSQTVTGKVYDDKTTAKSVKVQNYNNNEISYTDNNGNYSISASINDTLVFSSLFYKSKSILITEVHFKEVIVIQLKKIVNKLDEVLISETPKFKEFDAAEYNTNFKVQLENDKKERPYLYSIQQSNGVDFIAIAKMIGQLFKKKRTENVITYATYKDLDSLFKNDPYFNQKLLTNTLKITNDQRFLFFNYCEARKVNRDLLFEKNQFLLFDTLLNYSKAFHEIISEYTQE